MNTIKMPSDWISRRLKLVGIINMGQAPASDEVTEYRSDVNFAFLQGNAEFGILHPTPKHACNSPRKIARAGDLLLSVRAPVGALNVADRDYGIGRGLCAISWSDISPRFGWWALHHFRQQLSEVATGSTYEAVAIEDVGNLRILVPPYEEQFRIADYLDTETAQIDALVAEKERMLALLEEKRAVLISRAVTCGLDPDVPMKPSGLEWLGDIPVHWEVIRLKFLAEVRGGLTLGKNYNSSVLQEYSYLRVANVQDGHIVLDDVRKISVPESEARTCMLEKGDVLMNEGGDADKLGRGCIWHGEIAPCLHQNHVFSVRPLKVTPEWLDAWTSTREAKRYFESRAKQTTNLASISGTNIKEFPVIMPPKDEQIRILDFVVSERARTAELEETLQRSIALIKERRSALITAAVTGQLQIPDNQSSQ
ncbi:MAG: restriction endonuclease subunit S [Candidatus Contendobacter sp.]|nr:restriction endonuclease subunit S [Candidatus Contendobacter sp.]